MNTRDNDCKRISRLVTYEKGTGKFYNSRMEEVKGWVDSHGYNIISLVGCRAKAHRLAFACMGEELPEEVDHIDGVVSNNCWSNLNGTNRSGNRKNVKVQCNNKFGITGIEYKYRANSLWYYACIQINKKRIKLYYGKDLFEAYCRRKSGELKYGFTGRIA